MVDFTDLNSIRLIKYYKVLFDSSENFTMLSNISYIFLSKWSKFTHQNSSVIIVSTFSDLLLYSLILKNQTKANPFPRLRTAIHSLQSTHLLWNVFDIKQDKTETPSKDVMRRPH
jgi:hypothetical protein